MFCPQCQKQLSEHALYCTNCGTPIAQIQTETPQIIFSFSRNIDKEINTNITITNKQIIFQQTIDKKDTIEKIFALAAIQHAYIKTRINYSDVITGITSLAIAFIDPISKFFERLLSIIYLDDLFNDIKVFFILGAIYSFWSSYGKEIKISMVNHNILTIPTQAFGKQKQSAEQLLDICNKRGV